MICDAMAHGIRAVGDTPVVIDPLRYRGPTEQVAVFYGLVQTLPRILHDYSQEGRSAVFVDLGYWGRHSNYHKISVNNRHPTRYFQDVKHPPDRARCHGVRPKEWKEGRKILLAGMGEKGAVFQGYGPDQWEREAVAEIRKHTDRTIIYRPKPNWDEALPIDGTEFCPVGEPLERVFRDTYAVVTHHSNTAVEGLVEGIPAFVWDGVAQPMALQDLGYIETFYRPLDREQWIADIAYCQWNLQEMLAGLPWRHLKDEGLIP